VLAVSKSQAKKTPLGERGVRVIVVVANLVSVQRIGLWWIVVVVVTGLLIIVMCSFSCLIRYFWLRCLYSDFEIALRHRNLFCAQQYISKSCAKMTKGYIKQKFIKNGSGCLAAKFADL
jgi:hypothetical protein